MPVRPYRVLWWRNAGRRKQLGARGSADRLRRMFRFLTIAFVLCIAPGVARAGETELPDGDRLYWDDGLGAGAERVRKALPPIRRHVASVLGLGAPAPANIHVVSGWQRMREVAGMTVPEWAAGVCVGSRRLIALRADVADNPRLLRSLESVTRHEWVHYAWATAAGSRAHRLPLWVNEGLAEFIGGGLSADAGATLDIAASSRDLIPFQDIESRWPRGQYRAALAYAQSKSWIQYFRRRAGEDALRAVLSDVARGKGSADAAFDEAVWTHTKRPVSLWVEDWRMDLEATAKPWYAHAFNDLWTAIFLVIGIVGGISYFFIRARRRRERERMPDHDFPPGAEEHGNAPRQPERGGA